LVIGRFGDLTNLPIRENDSQHAECFRFFRMKIGGFKEYTTFSPKLTGLIEASPSNAAAGDLSGFFPLV
jgi:hypothetical protein